MLKLTDNPFTIFDAWMQAASESEPEYANAFSLATLDANGYPTARIVLLKGFDQQGFVFYTNLSSPKSSDIIRNPKVSMCFHWKSLHKQVRILGRASQVEDPVADEYFSTRARISQLGAWASKQSQLLEGKFQLEKRVAYFTGKFNVQKVPRPEFWSGYIIKPEKIEFWQEGKFRLHDRVSFTKKEQNRWIGQNLFP